MRTLIIILLLCAPAYAESAWEPMWDLFFPHRKPPPVVVMPPPPPAPPPPIIVPEPPPRAPVEFPPAEPLPPIVLPVPRDPKLPAPKPAKPATKKPVKKSAPEVSITVTEDQCRRIRFGMSFMGRDGVKRKAGEEGYTEAQVEAALRACGV